MVDPEWKAYIKQQYSSDSDGYSESELFGVLL